MILNGFINLCASKKGVLSLLILTSTVFLAVINKLNPTVAACFGIIHSIYCWTTAQTDIKSMDKK